MQGDVAAPPRCVEALAYIMERIERSGTAPSYGEIGLAVNPRVSKARVRQYVDKLVKLGAIERPAAARRGIRIRNLGLCRQLVDEALGQQGWWHAPQLGALEAPPCTIEQLPLIRLALHKREGS